MTDLSPPARATRFRTLWCLTFAVWAAALFLASPYDLELSQAIADPKNGFGRFIWLWGTTPSGVLYVAALAVLMVPRLRRNTSDLVQVAAVTLLVMALLHSLFITTSIKLLWGRQRFVELGGDWSRFTLFYQPGKPLAGESFPSGHVATAFVCSPLVFLLAREGRKAAAALLCLLVIAWGVTVAYGRILNGAHYLTDTIFSAGLSFLLAPFIVDLGRWTWNRWYRYLK